MTPRNQIKLQNNERKLKEIPVSDKGTSVLGQSVKHGYWEETIGSLGNNDGDVYQKLLCRSCTTVTYNFLISRFMDDVSTTKRFPFSFRELINVPLEFNSWKEN